MRVGLNLLYLLPGVVGGTETYAAGLIDGLSRVASDCDFVVFVNREAVEWPLPDGARFRRVVCEVGAASRIARYRFEQTRLPRLLRKHDVALVHSLGYVAPLRPGVPSVVSIHDLNFAALGEQMRPTRKWALRFFVRASARRASCILTLSAFSKREIVRVLGLCPDRVEVVYPAAGLRRSATTPLRPQGVGVFPDGSGRFILGFSSQSPHKNVPRLVQAFQHARRQLGLPHRLVLVGHLPAGIGAHELAGEGVSLLGFLDEASLAELMARADFLIFPSLYEGFGLPVIEAMQAGLPVACSSTAALPEIAGDAALFFDPTSVEAIAAAIERLAADEALRSELRRRGLVQAKRFSWEATAEATLNAYTKAAGSGQAQAGNPAGASAPRRTRVPRSGPGESP